jgi:hypothetical protein
MTSDASGPESVDSAASGDDTAGVDRSVGENTADDQAAHDDDQAHDDDAHTHADDDTKTDRQIGREAARYRRRLPRRPNSSSNRPARHSAPRRTS